jgi:hypothetical protein
VKKKTKYVIKSNTDTPPNSSLVIFKSIKGKIINKNNKYDLLGDLLKRK